MQVKKCIRENIGNLPPQVSTYMCNMHGWQETYQKEQDVERMKTRYRKYEKNTSPSEAGIAQSYHTNRY